MHDFNPKHSPPFFFSPLRAMMTAVLLAAMFALPARANDQSGTSSATISAMDQEVVLFGFDDRAFPYLRNAETHLFAAENGQMVLRPGPKGSHDETILYYGTVIRIGDTYRMWYNGNYGPMRPINGFEHQFCKLSYATSKDGVNWVKPKLGLVEFNGSKDNNIVDLPEPWLWSTAAVLYDPEDPNPARRFKIAYEAATVQDGANDFCVAFSPDGLHWTPSPMNPVGKFLEMGGVTKHDGLYYVVGQEDFTAHHQSKRRRLATYVSSDFVTWSSASAMSLDRGSDLTGPSEEDQIQQAEEVHVGAGLWNRGNVILGIYGQWHASPSGDRRSTVIDLGLVLSHDAVHYYEPIANFRIIPAREQVESPIGVEPALMQGQGMYNQGDETLYWYSLWRGNYGSGVRLVTWPRDRLGALEAFKPHDAHAISASVDVSGPGARAYVNASGLNENTNLRVELLDRGFHPVPGFNGDDAAVVSKDGFHEAITWPSGDALPTTAGPLRFRVRFSGVRPEDARFHALYVTGVEIN